MALPFLVLPIHVVVRCAKEEGGVHGVVVAECSGVGLTMTILMADQRTSLVRMPHLQQLRMTAPDVIAWLLVMAARCQRCHLLLGLLGCLVAQGAAVQLAGAQMRPSMCEHQFDNQQRMIGTKRPLQEEQIFGRLQKVVGT